MPKSGYMAPGLRYWRLRCALDRTALAGETGVSARRISRLERGGATDAATIQRLNEFLAADQAGPVACTVMEMLEPTPPPVTQPVDIRVPLTLDQARWIDTVTRGDLRQ